jgi:hypothetical protein
MEFRLQRDRMLGTHRGGVEIRQLAVADFRRRDGE